MLKYKLSILCLLFSASSFAQSTVQEDTYYTYNSDGYISIESKTQSNGDKLLTYYTYLDDMNVPSVCNTVGDGSWVKNLIGLNVRNKVVETYVTVQKANNGGEFVTGGNIYTYAYGTAYPQLMYAIETNAPIPMTSFTPCSISSSDCSLKMDSHYVLQETYSNYDIYGNLLEKEIKSGESFSYIYSFKGAYKIAEVIDANNSQVAYSSFETSDQGNWNYTASGCVQAATPIAGNICYNIATGAITSNTLPLGKYVLSYWSTGTGVIATPTGSVGQTLLVVATNGPTINGWTYHENLYQSTTKMTLSGSGDVDELRLYPQNAQMETMSYLPLIGVSYSCDAANHLTYYQYDDLNRLISVKDQNGNVIKKYEYGIQKTE